MPEVSREGGKKGTQVSVPLRLGGQGLAPTAPLSCSWPKGRRRDISAPWHRILSPGRAVVLCCITYHRGTGPEFSTAVLVQRWVCGAQLAQIGVPGGSQVTKKLQRPQTSAAAVNLLSSSPPSPWGFSQIQNVQTGAVNTFEKDLTLQFSVLVQTYVGTRVWEGCPA